MYFRETGAKQGLPEGPWSGEPDEAQWVDGDTELLCLIRRSPHVGILCGYVGVPCGHPWYGRDYNELPPQASAHGGLTYSGHFEEFGPDTWWVGFDCGHAWDLIPGFCDLRRVGTYRTFAYVQLEIVQLASAAGLALREEGDRS